MLSFVHSRRSQSFMLRMRADCTPSLRRLDDQEGVKGMADERIVDGGDRHDNNTRYSFSTLYETENAKTYLIREHDEYGEFPNIFAKVYLDPCSNLPCGIILIDTGTGLSVTSNSALTNVSSHHNIASLLEQTINPNHTAPYTVIVSHCHYDHIRGIKHLLNVSSRVQVYSSSHAIGFITPFKNLQQHSLCKVLGLEAPKYDTKFIDDGQIVQYEAVLDEQSQATSKTSSFTVLHIPGHTPDSIAVYDQDSHLLFVGDMFYERESSVTRSGNHGRWKPEPPQPVIFLKDSNIRDWSASMHKLLDFVRKQNEEYIKPDTGYRQNGQGTPSFISGRQVEDWYQVDVTRSDRVLLSAGHVSVNIDAESALLDMLDFMLRVQLDQVPRRRVVDRSGDGHLWLWEDQTRSPSNRFSIRSPWTVIHSSIPEPPKLETEPRSNATFLRSMMRPAVRKTPSSVFKASPTSRLAQPSVSATHTPD